MLEHVSSVKQLMDKKLLQDLFDSAAQFERLSPSDYPQPLKNKIIASLFFEPSTRTRFSFETAIQRLGGQMITVENGNASSSAVKGETIEDTIRVVNGYADGIIMRHPMKGAAEIAAKYAKVPFINAGDGGGDHPTQALLDMYTVHKAKGSADGLKVMIVGDLLNSRTAHALIYLLSLYNVEFYFVSPSALSLPEEYKSHLQKRSLEFSENESWDDLLADTDIIYMTRVQKERFDSNDEYKKYKDAYILDINVTNQLNKNSIILHALPRVNEIAPEVDDDPRALYFEQARNGLYTRMALLSYLFSEQLK